MLAYYLFFNSGSTLANMWIMNVMLGGEHQWTGFECTLLFYFSVLWKGWNILLFIYRFYSR